MKKFLSFLVLLSAALTNALAQTSSSASLEVQRAEIQAFITDMNTLHGFDRSALEATLSQARTLSEIQRLILPSAPGKPRSWQAYRARFVEPKRIRTGREFMATYAAPLAQAQTQFGVSAEIISAIIGIETLYGKQQGNFRVLDVLATLAFDFPREAPRDRSAQFRSQLEEYLLYTRRNSLAPDSVRGSFAGAIGIPQFMPSSLNQFAVDFDADGVVDLRNSVADAIGSVAAFLARHGWQSGMPVDFALDAQNTNTEPWLANDLQARYRASALQQAGFAFPETRPDDTVLLGVVDLETPDQATQYRAGSANFFAITKYNRSFFYAAAVSDLARALMSGLEQKTSTPPN